MFLLRKPSLLSYFKKKKEKSVRAEEHAQSEKTRKLERTLKKIRSVNINGSTKIEQVKKEKSRRQHHRHKIEEWAESKVEEI